MWKNLYFTLSVPFINLIFFFFFEQGFINLIKHIFSTHIVYAWSFLDLKTGDPDLIQKASLIQAYFIRYDLNNFENINFMN